MDVNFYSTINHGTMESYRENTFKVTNFGTDEIYFTHSLPWKFRYSGISYHNQKKIN